MAAQAHSPALQAELEKFKSSETKELSKDLNGLLVSIATTGKFSYNWNDVKPVVAFKIKEVLHALHNEKNDLYVNDQFEDVEERILAALESFKHAPFTLQRLCEILTKVRASYTSLRKYAAAVEKLLNVSSPDSSEPLTEGNAFTTASASPVPAAEVTKMDLSDQAPRQSMEVDDSATQS
eukprot:c14513_g1_i1.p1 GENE.c14513_g1_i1~~c14513_g1_i1.p1  ORF type:complete len:180 (-),score=47.81 c14513_g1_i1:31-570(-)